MKRIEQCQMPMYLFKDFLPIQIELDRLGKVLHL